MNAFHSAVAELSSNLNDRDENLMVGKFKVSIVVLKGWRTSTSCIQAENDEDDALSLSRRDIISAANAGKKQEMLGRIELFLSDGSERTNRILRWRFRPGGFRRRGPWLRGWDCRWMVTLVVLSCFSRSLQR
jgi:hypothetical protein